MSLENLSLIGHIGNFVVEKGEENKTPNESPHKISLYDNPFEFSGTGDLLAGTGIFSSFDSQEQDVSSAITGTMQGSHNVKLLSFGLDSIFNVGQTGGFLPDLKSASLMKFVNVGNMVAGLKLPSAFNISFGKGRGR